MPKISDLPETTGLINYASLLPLVQGESTTKTTFNTLSSNIFNVGIKFGTYTARFVSNTGTTDPVYTEQFFTNGSKYALIGEKLVLFTSICYVQAGSISSGGSGIAAVLLPTLGTYSHATGMATWHRGFNLGAGFTTIGFSVGSSGTRLALRALQTQATTGSPDIYWSGAPAGFINCPMVNDMSVVMSGWGILN
jgi:hypothetical protein